MIADSMIHRRRVGASNSFWIGMLPPITALLFLPLKAIAGPAEFGCAVLSDAMDDPQNIKEVRQGCKEGTTALIEAVSSIVEKYFDNEDQALADKFCITIIYSEGKKIIPRTKENCSK